VPYRTPNTQTKSLKKRIGKAKNGIIFSFFHKNKNVLKLREIEKIKEIKAKYMK
jgi:hypothetical protein